MKHLIHIPRLAQAFSNEPPVSGTTPMFFLCPKHGERELARWNGTAYVPDCEYPMVIDTVAEVDETDHRRLKDLGVHMAHEGECPDGAK